MSRAILFVLALHLVPVGPSHAQRLAPPIRSFQPSFTQVRAFGLPAGHQTEPAPGDRGSVGRAIGFGVLFGAAGFVAGALIGDAASDECDFSSDLCIAEAAFYGAAGGGTLGMAAGVHLGNHRQGNVLLDFLVAGAVWGTGIAIAFGTDDDTTQLVTLIAIPVVQLGATVAVERATGRRRSPV